MSMRSEFYAFSNMVFAYTRNKNSELLLFERRDSRDVYEGEENLITNIKNYNNYIVQNTNYHSSFQNQFLKELSTTPFCEFYVDNYTEENAEEDFNFTREACENVYFANLPREQKPSFNNYLTKFHTDLGEFLLDVKRFKKREYEYPEEFLGGKCSSFDNPFCTFHHPVIPKSYIFRTKMLTNAFKFFSQSIKEYILINITEQHTFTGNLALAFIIFLIVFLIVMGRSYYSKRLQESLNHNIVFGFLSSTKDQES